MLDLDLFPKLYWGTSVSNDVSSKNLSNATRQNIKILTDAQDKSYQYSIQKNRLGWTFESLLRSVGLAAGVVLGGPVGAATMSAIGGGVGRGVGEYFGNRIYGESMGQLDQIIQDYKFKQATNYQILRQIDGTKDMINELYNQTYSEHQKLAEEIGQSVG